MIKTYLTVEDICNECPNFEPTYQHNKLYSDEKIHAHHILIECKNRTLCEYLRSYVEKERK